MRDGIFGILADTIEELFRLDQAVGNKPNINNPRLLSSTTSDIDSPSLLNQTPDKAVAHVFTLLRELHSLEKTSQKYATVKKLIEKILSDRIVREIFSRKLKEELANKKSKKATELVNSIKREMETEVRRRYFSIWRKNACSKKEGFVVVPKESDDDSAKSDFDII